jgi:hypothetical protein
VSKQQLEIIKLRSILDRSDGLVKILEEGKSRRWVTTNEAKSYLSSRILLDSRTSPGRVYWMRLEPEAEWQECPETQC